MENLELKAKLHKKMTEIQMELGTLQKDGNAVISQSGAGYAYISYENLNSELKVLLFKYKISIIPEIDDCIVSKNDKKTMCNLRLLIHITDTETGYSEVFKTFAYSEDNGDKVVGKAFTEALKRWEFKAFHVTSQDSKLFDIDFCQDDKENNKIDITPKKPEPKTDKKPEPKTDNKPDESNLRVALMQLITEKKADNNMIMKVLGNYGFKNADEVPVEQHEKLLRVIPELYQEFLKSEEYKKSKKETK